MKTGPNGETFSKYYQKCLKNSSVEVIWKINLFEGSMSPEIYKETLYNIQAAKWLHCQNVLYSPWGWVKSVNLGIFTVFHNYTLWHRIIVRDTVFLTFSCIHLKGAGTKAQSWACGNFNIATTRKCNNATIKKEKCLSHERQNEYSIQYLVITWQDW